MTRKLTPDDFKGTLLDDLYHLYISHKKLTINGYPLDPQSMQWIITQQIFRQLYHYRDMSIEIDLRKKTLFGIPMRITIYDEPDVTPYQLVMEPMLKLNPK